MGSLSSNKKTSSPATCTDWAFLFRDCPFEVTRSAYLLSTMLPSFRRLLCTAKVPSFTVGQAQLAVGRTPLTSVSTFLCKSAPLSLSRAFSGDVDVARHESIINVDNFHKAEAGLSQYLKNEVKLLKEHTEKQKPILDSINEWLDVTGYKLHMNRNEIILTRSVDDRNVTIKISPELMPFDPSEEAEEGAYDDEQDDEEAESEGGSSVGFEVLVDRGDKRLGFQCIASSSSEYHITSVTIGKDQPVSYEVMRLDEAGYEKFLHYLDALGIDDTFVNVVNYCVQVHDDQIYAAWLKSFNEYVS